MNQIVKALVETVYTGYFRPDHGRMIWGETGKPGETEKPEETGNTDETERPRRTKQTAGPEKPADNGTNNNERQQ